jgi:hypothetical protein
MDWIKSGGGPLICAEREVAVYWRGVTRTNEELDLSADELSDYDRGCRVRDYLGVLKVGRGHAVILGDMPLETSVWKDGYGNVLIVRLFYIDAGADVPGILRGINDSCFDDPNGSVDFEITSGQMVIFDSAFPGIEQEKKTLAFETSRAMYRILTKVVKPDSQTSILLHKFFVVM